MKRLLPVWLWLGVLCGCHAASTSALPDLAAASSSAQVSLDQVQRVGVVERASDDVAQRRYAFQPAAHPQIVLTPAGGAWDWSEQGELRIRVQNAMPWSVTVRVEIDGAAGQRLQTSVGVPAGPAQTLVIPLQATSPRAQGMQVGPPMPFDDHGRLTLLATTVEGVLDRHHVQAIRLEVPAPQAAQTLLFGQVQTAADVPTLHDAYAGIVDRYGQFTRASWPEKITSDATLQVAEKTVLPDPVKVGTDAYGGRLDVHGLGRTGWFHVQELDGRWYLVTPDGHAFFSLGVNAVASDGGRSYVQGREFMFRDLPPDSGTWAAFYGSGDSRQAEQGASAGVGDNHGRWFDFYAANLYRVDGAGWLTAWRGRALDRLQAWGFNTIGNWSDAALGQAHRLPYTRSINIAGTYANVASGYDYWGRMPDPFDPRFAQATEQAVAKASDGARDDSYLLGYFADNELAWAGTGPQGRWGLALGTLAGAATSPASRRSSRA